MVRGNDKVEAKRRKVLKLGRHTASGTAFEMCSLKGEVNEKNTQSAREREGTVDFILLPRLISFHFSPSKYD
jgi:hypothetical protein